MAPWWASPLRLHAPGTRRSGGAPSQGRSVVEHGDRGHAQHAVGSTDLISGTSQFAADPRRTSNRASQKCWARCVCVCVCARARACVCVRALCVRCLSRALCPRVLMGRCGSGETWVGCAGACGATDSPVGPATCKLTTLSLRCSFAHCRLKRHALAQLNETVNESV